MYKNDIIVWIVADILVGFWKFLNHVPHENPSRAVEGWRGKGRTNWSSLGWPDPERTNILVVAERIQAQIKLRGELRFWSQTRRYLSQSPNVCGSDLHLKMRHIWSRLSCINHLRVGFNITTRFIREVYYFFVCSFLFKKMFLRVHLSWGKRRMDK